ncbi:hypothetical protein E2F46_05020 [Luteimonas aestuarii]|uniref:Bacterial Pleckstrin homology domain-containing protein n=1 Tax=Luteimonas aestuarii TaxID=453837 RepID=A0A4R5TXV3_9GAMM|nr:hypothetical protein [Luteimonas aestuarii]TDK25971.1 hypothetical protein E2F46_05020 [Luteimonas aestuarii]
MTTQTFPLAPMNRLAPLVLVVPAAGIALAVLVAPREQATPLPMLATAFMFALVIAGPLLGLLRRRITLDGHTLVVAATAYTQRIPVDAFDLDSARVVDLDERTEFRPMLGINRFGLPGFRAGYYVLRNRVRGFCLLTRFQRVLVLPRRDGRFVLLSPEQPQALLSRLRELAATPTRG